VGGDDRHVEGCPVPCRDRGAPPGLHRPCGDCALQRQRPREGSCPGGRAGCTAPRRHACRAPEPAGGRVQRDRRGDRSAAGSRRDRNGPLRRRSRRRRDGQLRHAGAVAAHRDARAARRPERDVGRLPHGTRRPPRRLSRLQRGDRGADDGRRRALGRGHADHRGGTAVGRHGRGQHARRSPTAGHRAAHRRVHRADGHGDRERRGPGRGGAPGRRAGGAPARRHAGRAGSGGQRGLRRGDNGGRRPPGRLGGDTGPLRG
jgi:hypothetical protein